MRYTAKLCADRSNRCRDMAVIRFFKMAAVHHLGFIKKRPTQRAPNLAPSRELAADGHI